MGKIGSGFTSLKRKLTVFDIFLVLVVLIGAALVGIRLISGNALTLKGTRPIEITFLATGVPPEIAAKIQDGEDTLVNNFFFGKSNNVRVEPDMVEYPDENGVPVLSRSNLIKRVYVTVETDAVKGSNGYQRGNVKINIGENYFLYVGKVKLPAKIVEINEK